MYRLVEQGHVAGERYAQVGLRGYWPGEEEFAWQREHGITALRMREVAERGIADVLAEAIEAVGPGPSSRTRPDRSGSHCAGCRMPTART